MIGSPFGFHYRWQDIQPIRPLVLTVAAAQLGGAVLGYLALAGALTAFDRVWIGGAAATLPGYLIGCAVQYLAAPRPWTEHRLMIQRLGMLAILFSALALCVYRSKLL